MYVLLSRWFGYILKYPTFAALAAPYNTGVPLLSRLLRFARGIGSIKR